MLALEIRYFGFKGGFDVNKEWAKSDEKNRKLMVEAFTSAKDTDKFSYTDTTGFGQWGVSSYDEIVNNGMIK